MNDQSNLLFKTKEWITGQGYPLEMRTSLAFHNAGFEVLQSELYEDVSTKKSREIDIVAIAPNYVGYSNIGFAVECKSSSKPWVLFTTNRGAVGLIYSAYALMSKEALDALFGSVTSGDPNNSVNDQLERLRWLKKPKDVAYAMRQAFTDSDIAYSALTSSIKAASQLAKGSPGRDYPQLRFWFPLIVVDSPLFLCRLDESFEPELTQVDSGEVQFNNPDERRATACIRVVTSTKLPTFIAEAREEISRLSKEIRPTIETIWKDRHGSPFPEKLWDIGSTVAPRA